MFREIGEERTFNGILKQIIENIQKGTLKAGAALPAERVMAEAMGVSRSAVREVLRALELLGKIYGVFGGDISEEEAVENLKKFFGEDGFGTD